MATAALRAYARLTRRHFSTELSQPPSRLAARDTAGAVVFGSMVSGALLLQNMLSSLLCVTPNHATNQCHVTLAAPAQVATTFGLGCWQTLRYFQKRDEIARREAALELPPVDLDADAGA